MKTFKTLLMEIVLEREGFHRIKNKESVTPERLQKALDGAGYKEYTKTAPTWAKPAEEDGTIDTLEGPMKYKKGDYLCVGPNGDRWPVYKDVFDDTYELTGDEE
jgi:hypothetical protein